MNIRKTILALIFTLFLFSVSTLACTCVRDSLKARGFSGQVIAAYDTRPDDRDPIEKATVKLLKRTNNGDKIFAEITTDVNGRFAVENLKPGKYILEVSATHFETVVTEIKVLESSNQKKDELLVGLQPSLDCCAGYAKVQKTKKKS